MPETLLDFDTADASGDRGAVTVPNLKTNDINLHIPEISAIMRYGHSRSPMPSFAHLDLAISHAKPSLKGAYLRWSGPLRPGLFGRKGASWNRAKRKGG
jgi:hypothetical protein